jgi:hypothetical protein
LLSLAVMCNSGCLFPTLSHGGRRSNEWHGPAAGATWKAPADNFMAKEINHHGKPAGDFRVHRNFADRARGLSVRSANDARTGSSDTAA